MFSLSTLQNLIDQSSTIAIFWHRHPDGDCLWSMLWWGKFLEWMWKKVSYFVPTSYPDDFHFLPGIEKVQVWFDASKHYDILFFLDTATHDGQLEKIRIDNAQYFENHKNKVVIDHHISNTKYGDINIIHTQASSTCELIIDIIQKWTQVDNNISINKNIANALLLGISTDTGHFKRATTANTFSLVSYLLEQWGDVSFIVENIYRKNSWEQIQFTQLLLSRIQKRWNIIFTRYTQAERKQYGLEKKFVEQALDIMTSMKHDGIFLFFKGQELEEVPHLRCSRRTKNPAINVAELASHFNGWWHRAAAGSQIEIKNTFQETMQEVLEKTQSLLIY